MIGLSSYFILERRMFLMLGMTLGLNNAFAAYLQAGPAPIVAWGDSLTAGGYPALAGALFSPPRTIVNRGVGGQGSTQIAARQGGRPIVVSVANDSIPMAVEMEWDFSADTAGWYANGFNADDQLAISLLPRSSDSLLISTTGNAAGGNARTLLGHRDTLGIVAGSVITISATISENSTGSGQEIGILSTANSNGSGGGWFTPTRSFAANGTTTVTNVAAEAPSGSYLAIALWMSGNPARSIVLTSPKVTIVTPVAVIEKSINILQNSGNYGGRIEGRLAGVHGTMSSDSAGNWTFTRDEFGPAVACPPGSQFLPDETRALRDHTVWIWAGRNNFGDAETVKADIAAMISHLGHARFLVAGVINGNYSGEFYGTPGYAGLLQLNTDLADRYGAQFVDVRKTLIAAADPTADAIWIERDTVPASLRTDNIHLNAAGNAIVAKAMYEATIERGW